MSGQELGYAEYSTVDGIKTFSSLDDFTELTLPNIVVTDRPVIVEAFAPVASNSLASASNNWYITDENGVQKAKSNGRHPIAGAALRFHAIERIATAGTYTRKVRAHAVSGTLSIYGPSANNASETRPFIRAVEC